MNDIIGSLASFLSEHATIEETKEMLLAAQANQFNVLCFCFDKGIALEELVTALKLSLSRRGAY